MNTILNWLAGSAYLLVGIVILLAFAAGLRKIRAVNVNKLTFILALVLVSIGVVKPDFSRTGDVFHKFIRGVDLSGGTILVYEVDRENQVEDFNMDNLVNSLKERLDPKGMFNYSIRALGVNQVEIIMPRAHEEDVDRVKQLISTVGQLQFMMVANRRFHDSVMDIASGQWPAKRRIGESAEFIRFGVWLPLNKLDKAHQTLIERAKDGKPNQKIEVTVDNARIVLRYVPIEEATLEKKDPKRHVLITGPNGREFILARWDDDGVHVDSSEYLVREDAVTGERYLLMAIDEYRVRGEYLRRVSPTYHEMKLAVAFTFNAEGAAKFGELTERFSPRNQPDGYESLLGVVLDNRVRNAAGLRERISGSGVITLGSSATKNEVDRLVKILSAGQLPVALNKEPASQFQIDSTLGSDTIQKGQIAIVASFAVVVIFIIAYYRTAGVVAILGLFFNLLFTVALMVLLKATWTLPGLAGLVLTIGMSVDANVLIYERMREEQDRGASLGMAIRNGYSKAWSAILDGNVTTILSAVILYVIGTDMIRGFAVTLVLGLLTSMFCAVYVTRAIFEMLYAKRWLQQLSMMRLMSATNFDFLRLRRTWIAASLIVIAVGMVGVAIRGADNFDIDLLGGTLVQVKFRQDKGMLDSGQVRELASAKLANVSVESVQYSGEQPGFRYIIRTTEQGEAVRQNIIDAFGDRLDTPQLASGPIQPVPDKPADESIGRMIGGKQVELTVTPARRFKAIRGLLVGSLPSEGNQSNPDDLFALVALTDEGTPAIGTESGEYSRYLLAVSPEVKLETGLERAKNNLAVVAAFDQMSMFGPQVAGETQTRAIWAILLSWVVIIIYVAFRFHSWEFGIAGVVALVHDSMAAVGLTALFSLAAVAAPGLEWLLISDMKINLTVIAAVLTLIGYSINDTIVIFDRVREIRGKSPQLTTALFNRSLNETLSRTIITSLTVFMVVIVLYVGGGVTIRGFTFVLLLGLILGTYSTVYIASPVVLYLTDMLARRRARQQAGGRPRTAAAL